MSGILETFNYYKSKIVKWKNIDLWYVANILSPALYSACFTFEDKYFQIFCFNSSSERFGINLHILFSLDEDFVKKNFDFDIGIERADGSMSTVKNKKFEFDKTEFLGTDGSFIDATAICVIHHQENTTITSEKCFATNAKEVSTQTVSIECIEHLSENLKELFINGRHADITIKVGSKAFQAHKLLLSARSPVLDSMFSDQMLENETGILNINDTDESAFEAFLMFLYTGRIDQILISKVVELYEIGDKYDIEVLKAECVKRLIIEMSVDLVGEALRLSALHEEKLLMETATKYFMDNVEEVLQTDKWESFMKDHFKFGNELLVKYISAKPK